MPDWDAGSSRSLTRHAESAERVGDAREWQGRRGHVSRDEERAALIEVAERSVNVTVERGVSWEELAPLLDWLESRANAVTVTNVNPAVPRYGGGFIDTVISVVIWAGAIGGGAAVVKLGHLVAEDIHSAVVGHIQRIRQRHPQPAAPGEEHEVGSVVIQLQADQYYFVGDMSDDEFKRRLKKALADFTPREVDQLKMWQWSELDDDWAEVPPLG